MSEKSLFFYVFFDNLRNGECFLNKNTVVEWQRKATEEKETINKWHYHEHFSRDWG